MRILIVTEAIHPGGAETFLLRLSQAFHEKGHQVIIYNFHKEIYHRELHQNIAPGVSVVCAKLPFVKLLKIADSAFLKFRINISLRSIYLRRDLKKIIKKLNPDIIHSHLFKADVECCKAAQSSNTPVVSTMHGDYAMYYYKYKQGVDFRISNFGGKLRFVLTNLKNIICISSEQMLFFRDQMQPLVKNRLQLSKLYNGYSAKKSTGAPVINRCSLGIPENAFVYGMVARGIASKGWEELIEAFYKLNREDTFLVLVGGSDYVNELREKHASQPRIIFAGTVIDPLNWIDIFDVGLLPSYFGSESLPTVIMEYLYCQKPVIATKIGEIPAMIQYENSKAGILVDIINGRTDVQQLSDAMMQLYANKASYHLLKQATLFCFRQFEMERCVLAYEQIYKQNYG